MATTDFVEKMSSEKYALALLQLRHDRPDNRYIRFESYDSVVKELGKEPTADLYEVMWVEPFDPNKFIIPKGYMEYEHLNCPYSDKDKEYIAESMFNKFNRTRTRPTIQDGYYGTSASVSDVILIKEDDKIYAMYIDSMGFKEIEDFQFQMQTANTKHKTEIER